MTRPEPTANYEIVTTNRGRLKYAGRIRMMDEPQEEKSKKLNDVTRTPTVQ